MRSDTPFHFLFFGLTSFSSLPQREQAIALECARLGHKVDFIEIPPSIAGNAQALFNNLFSPLSRDSGFAYDAAVPNLRIHTPPTLPTGFRNSLTPAIDRMLFRRWFSAAFNNVDFSNVVAMVMMPLWWNNFIDRNLFDPGLLVYDICDSLEVQSRDDGTIRRLRIAEAALGTSADLITYSAEEMDGEVSEKFPNARTLFLPNAVSVDFIARVEREPLFHRKDTPPTIGYVGAMSGKWIDTNLLLAAIRECADCLVSIIGPVDQNFATACAPYPNVTLHGYVSHDELASHLRRFDVAIIPFLDNEITRVVNPLKLYEYCAAGLPVVATRTAELAHYAGQIYLARDSADFIDSIRLALAEDTPELHASRRLFAAEHTWEDRVSRLISRLNELVIVR
jgi:glycosyltransferase involved in cell wall biosynthesis